MGNKQQGLSVHKSDVSVIRQNALFSFNISYARHCLERRHLILSPSLVVHVAVLSVVRQEKPAPVYVAAATNAQSSLPPPTSFLW